MFKTHFLCFCATLALLLDVSAATADVLYWESNDDTAGFGTASGTWAAPTGGTATAGWSLDSTGATVVNGNSVTTTVGDQLNFGTDTLGLGAGTINVSGTVAADQLLFGKASGNVTLNGGTINMNTGTALIRATTGGGSVTNTHTLNSNISKTNGGIVRFGTQNTTGESYVVNGVLSGDFRLDSRMRNNTAALTLNGLNTFTGNTSIVTGQINANTIANAGAASSLGAGTTISMSGGGGQAPALVYTGNSSASTDRAVNLNGGTNRFAAQDASLTLAGAVTGTSGGFESNVFLSGDAGGGSNFNEVSGVISGNARVQVGAFTPVDGVVENGVWKVSGNNSYTGTTTVSNASTLIVANSNALGDTAAGTSVENGAQLLLEGGIAVGAEALTLNSSAAASWDGNTGASLRSLSGNNSWAGDVTLATNSTIAVNSGSTLTMTGVIGQSGGVSSLTKSGAGTLDVQLRSTYTGATSVDGGTLRFTNDQDLRSVGSSQFNINNGSTLEFQSSVGGANRTVLNNKTFTFDGNGGGTVNFNGGNHLFQGGNSHTFTTTGGVMNTISSTNGGFMNMQGTGNIVFNVADGTDSVDLEFSASFNNGQITKNGAGTLSITTSTNAGSGNNTVDVNAGTLQLATGVTLGAGAAPGDVTIASGATLAGVGTVGGSTTISGTHAPGIDGAGIQAFAGDLNYSANAMVDWELEANTVAGRGTNFDGINVTGDLDFAGTTTLNLDFLTGVDFGDGFWATDQTWNIWNVSGTTTGFSNLMLGSLSNDSLGGGVGSVNGSFSLVQSGSDVNLFFTASSAAVPEPSSFALIAMGFVAFGVGRKRKRQQSRSTAS